MTKSELKISKDLDRRNFIKKVVFGGGTIVLFSNFGFLHLSTDKRGIIRAVVVDYNKCTGCRTCETVCSSYNHKEDVNGKNLPGLGNPFYSNIKVYNYNPDADVPVVCAMCPDSPCIETCPVSPDPQTGRKALYRDEKTFAIKNDEKRCIGCGMCSEICKTKRVGVIVSNPETNKPERICTLCDGDPQCVKNCPYDALSYIEVDTKRELFGMSPDDIAKELSKQFYNF